MTPLGGSWRFISCFLALRRCSLRARLRCDLSLRARSLLKVLWLTSMPPPVRARTRLRFRPRSFGVAASLQAEKLRVLYDLPVAARWPDDIRRNDKQYHRGAWHYINWPFKPERQPVSVQVRDPDPVNILTALAENESVVKTHRPRWQC